MLTEKQAWLYLANKWENANRIFRNRFAIYIVDIYGSRATGLCYCIGSLYDCRMISYDTMEYMKLKIRNSNNYKYNPKFFPFCWAFNKKGSKQRARFCKKMAHSL